MASVEWSDDALADLEKIDTPPARRVVAKVLWFGEHFAEVIPEPLHGSLKGLFKLRAGDYRVIYSVQAQHVMIEAVRHRSSAYKP